MHRYMQVVSINNKSVRQWIQQYITHSKTSGKEMKTNDTVKLNKEFTITISGFAHPCSSKADTNDEQFCHVSNGT